MCDSVHTARWISQFKGTDLHFQLFPSTPHRKVHRVIRSILGRPRDSLATLRPTDRYTALVFGVLDLLLGHRIQAWRLRRLVVRGDFQAVHLLETQHAGYLFNRAFRDGRCQLPVALSVWGSDLAWFAGRERHRRLIRETLGQVTLLFVECTRDVALARDLGYAGDCLPPMSASGGVGAIANLQRETVDTPPSARRAIVVKGYTGFVGRATTSIKAVVANRHLLDGYTIHVYSCSLLMLVRIRLVRILNSIDVRAYRKKSLSHDRVLELFRQSRASLSVSLSDGLPGSLREAVWTGAFPIESTGSCVHEWMSEGTQVLLVDPRSQDSVTDGLRRVLTDDSLVDRAQIENSRLARRFSIESTRLDAIRGYERLGLRPANGSKSDGGTS